MLVGLSCLCLCLGSVTSLLWDPDSQFLLSVGAGEKHVHVWHNIPGLRISIQELEDKRPEAKGNEVYKVSY